MTVCKQLSTTGLDECMRGGRLWKEISVYLDLGALPDMCLYCGLFSAVYSYNGR